MSIEKSLQDCKDRVAAAQAAVDAAKSKLESAKLELKQIRESVKRYKGDRTWINERARLSLYSTHESLYYNELWLTTKQVPSELLTEYRVCDKREEGFTVQTVFRKHGIVVCNTYDPRQPLVV